MALGDIADYSTNRSLELLASATATNSPPSGASAGVPVTSLQWDYRVPDTVTLLIYSTAGSGTITVTCRIWGYHPKAAEWFPLGTGTASGKGVVNNGAAIAEDQADQISHAEPLDLPIHFTRLYLEITAIGGTSTAVTADLIFGPTTIGHNI